MYLICVAKPLVLLMCFTMHLLLLKAAQTGRSINHLNMAEATGNLNKTTN